MLNLNSPTVQAMLKNTPQGIGNIPIYYGNDPTISSSTYPNLNDTQTPYPSPKEMLINGGQSAIYSPTSFVPRNIVGGYNPGFNLAFENYSNPYMNYGVYGGYPNMYGTGYGYGYMMTPPDEDARDRLEAANNNGISYDEQLIGESNLYKKISRIVSKNLNRDEDEAKKCEDAFNIYNKYPEEDIYCRKKIKPIHIQLKVGGEVVADNNPEKIEIKEHDYIRNASYVDQMKIRKSFVDSSIVTRMNQIYMQMPERMFDNTDMLDFFNNGAGVLMADSLNRELQMQNISRTSKLYDRDGFRKQLLENNGLRSREQITAVERFAGRYGIMPDGRPVTPGRDPSIAESFSYNPNTGQYSVTAPNFIRDRLERARESFIRSI